MTKPSHTQSKLGRSKLDRFKLGRSLGRKLAKGYTMVEVMMGLAVLAVGAAAIVGLQRFTVLGTLTSRELTNATSVATNILETMEGESLLWTDNSTFGGTPWLETSVVPTPGTWTAPPQHAFTLDGLQIDATAPGAAVVAYCAHVRSTFLGNSAGGGGSGSLDTADTVRVEVRVFFAKTGRNIALECQEWDGEAEVKDLLEGNIPQPVSASAVPHQRSEYGVVYLTTILRRNSP